MNLHDARRQAVDSARRLHHRARTPSGRLRVLPDFLIIGAQKAGTTSLYADLCHHPAVRAAVQKEVHYFDEHHDYGDRWYRSMFPLTAQMELARRRLGTVLTGEATPYYLFHPLVPARVRRSLPDAKIIVLLRDPAERAWSHYRHEVTAGRESLSFAAALDAEPARLAAVADAVRSGATGPRVASYRTSSYLARGHYAEQLQRWFAEYPREAFHFVRSEDLFGEPAQEWQRLTAFLGLDETPLPEFEARNRGRDEAMDPGLRDELHEHYAASNRALVELLGPRFSWAA